MTSARLYVELAKRTFLLAAGESDPLIKELLTRRAHEYLRMADALSEGPVVQQQQQQVQPKKDDDKE
jgi:predicted esterase